MMLLAVIYLVELSLNKSLNTQAGPISKKLKSSINDGFFPSILWPTN